MVEGQRFWHACKGQRDSRQPAGFGPAPGPGRHACHACNALLPPGRADRLDAQTDRQIATRLTEARVTPATALREPTSKYMYMDLSLRQSARYGSRSFCAAVALSVLLSEASSAPALRRPLAEKLQSRGSWCDHFTQ